MEQDPSACSRTTWYALTGGSFVFFLNFPFFSSGFRFWLFPSFLLCIYHFGSLASLSLRHLDFSLFQIHLALFHHRTGLPLVLHISANHLGLVRPFLKTKRSSSKRRGSIFSTLFFDFVFEMSFSFFLAFSTSTEATQDALQSPLVVP